MRSNCICFQFINLMYSDNNGACYCICLRFLFRTRDFCVLSYSWRIWNFNISKPHEMSIILSSSKSALNPLQTNGCKQIMRSSTKLGGMLVCLTQGWRETWTRGGNGPPLIFQKIKYIGTNFNNFVI